MDIDALRDDIALRQKKGLPYIIGSVVIWILIAVVCSLDIPVMTRNMLVFCCSCPLLPIAWLAGKALKIDIFGKENPLGNLGFIFTMNQILNLLIVMWVYAAVPEKMVMVYAMVFGAHLLPYSWLYRSRAYFIYAVAVPLISLIVGIYWNALWLCCLMILLELVFVIILSAEVRKLEKQTETAEG
ncbi:MAG: hypothetical protein J5744_00805 [Oscillospiraceae bacterium]|nr:hypothetical protein [Oscillospiraceae bacterium]